MISICSTGFNRTTLVQTQIKTITFQLKGHVVQKNGVANPTKANASPFLGSVMIMTIVMINQMKKFAVVSSFKVIVFF